MTFKRKTVYQIICVGTYGDADCVEYIAETKEIADKYLDYCNTNWPSLKYTIESIDMLVDEE